MKNTSSIFRATAALAVVAAPLIVGGVASADRSAPTGPTGDCDWVDPAAVAELPVHEAALHLEELTTLQAAFSATHLPEQLEADGPFTIFAPSNAAFEEIPVNVFDSIVADPALLTSILEYHVVVGDSFTADELASEGTVETLNGTLDITTEGETLVVNGVANVTCAGIETANATIFVLDQVLQPASSELGMDGSSSVPGSSTPGSSVPGVSVPADEADESDDTEMTDTTES